MGEALTADTSGISDSDGRDGVGYQWMAGGVDFQGATGASYTLTEDEEGKAISVGVGFTDDAGNA